jgi:hypothetical protein
MENISISKSEYVELLRYTEMVQVLEDLIHEPKFKEDFVNRVLEAEKRAGKGDKLGFNSVKEMSAYFERKKKGACRKFCNYFYF